MTLQQFNEKYGMKRKLIFCNSTELYKREVQKSVAEGIPSVNCEQTTPVKYAKVLLRDYFIGHNSHVNEIDKQMQTGIMIAIIFGLIRDEKLNYFTENMIDSKTAQQFLTDIKLLRMENKLEDIKDDEDEKLKDIYIIAGGYIGYLSKSDLYDDVLEIEKVINLISNNEIDIEADVVGIYQDTYNELTEMEKNLLNKISNGKSVQFIEKITSEGMKPSTQFFNVFGLHNEIRAVVKDIISNRIPWEQVQIISSNTEGYYPLMTYLKELGIPYCMPEGVSEKYSYMATQINRYLHNPAYFEADSNGGVDIKKVFDDLAKYLEDIIKNGNSYLLQPTKISLNNKISICRRISSCYNSTSVTVADCYMAAKMVENILLSENIIEDNDEEGHIYISSLAYAETAFRPYVYFIGFEAKKYPGGEKQSPILLDDDMEKIKIPIHHMACNRQKKIDEKLDSIKNSVSKKMTISYVSYDTVNMREQNPSVFYQKVLKEQECEAMELKFGFIEENKDDILEKREWLLYR